MADQDSQAALDMVADYAAEQAAKDPSTADRLKRYAATSAQFASVGGALGTAIPIPGVGTAMGALVGAGAGILYEGGKDIIDAVFPDDPKTVKESPEKAERAAYAYQELGGERGTKMPYPQWWKTYVAAGRPSIDVLLAARRAQDAAERVARNAGVPPPPPPPSPRVNAAGGSRVGAAAVAPSGAIVESGFGGGLAALAVAAPVAVLGYLVLRGRR